MIVAWNPTCLTQLLICRFCERAQALIHGDLHTGSVMVTTDSTQVIDPEFAFYGPMGFDIGAYLGNLILAFFAQDGHADQVNDREVCTSFPYVVSSCLWWICAHIFICMFYRAKISPEETHEFFNLKIL